MADKRRVYWMRFSEGAAFAVVAAGNNSRLLVPSIREAEVGREYEGFTITRLIINVTLRSATTLAVVTMGVIVQQEDIALATVQPAADPHADWFWCEEFLANDSGDDSLQIHRDIRSQRKARGGDSEVYIYVVNRSGVNIEVHRSGSMLVKRA